MAKAELVDVEVFLHHESRLAYLVSTDGDSDNAVWVPKSQCELERVRGNTYELTTERFVAEQKGLV